MAYQQLTWRDFAGGLNTRYDPEQMALNEFQVLRNFRFTKKGSLRKRAGSTVVGTDSVDLSGLGGVTSIGALRLSTGVIVKVKTVGTYALYLDPADDTWKTINDSATHAAIAFTAGKKFSYAQATEGVQQSQRDLGNSGGQTTYSTTFTPTLFFGNGVENCYKWTGPGNEAVKLSSTTETVGSMLVFWHQRLYIAGNPNTPTRLCFSKLLQQSQTTVSFTIALGGATGDAGFKSFDAEITSLKRFVDKDGAEFLLVGCANNTFYKVTISEDTTLGTQMRTEEVKQFSTTVNNGTTTYIENDVAYVDLEGHVRSLGFLPTKQQIDTSVLSSAIDPSTEALDFADGAAAYSGRNLHLSGASVAGGTVDTQFTYDQFYTAWWEYVPAYRSFLASGADLYAGSSTSGNVYLLGRGASDGQAPIAASFRTKEISGGDLKLNVDDSSEALNDSGVGRCIRCREIRLKGSMTENCEFTVNVYFDRGSTPVDTFVCSADTGVVRSGSSSGSWGTFVYGGGALWGGGSAAGSSEGEREFFLRLELGHIGDAFSMSFEAVNNQAGVALEFDAMSGFFELCPTVQLEPRYTLPDTVTNVA